MSIVSDTGTFVNKLSISKLTIKVRSKSERSWISLVKPKTSDTVYSDEVRGANNGTENFASL
jgi:hypothetical protein